MISVIKLQIPMLTCFSLFLVCSAFRELLKLLFGYRLEAVFHGENPKIKSALKFCLPL